MEEDKIFKLKKEFEEFIDNFKSQNINYDTLDERQNRLRDIRNELSNKYIELNTIIQQEIDNLEIHKNNADKFINNYIKIPGHYNTYIYVDVIYRLFNGIRVKGYGYNDYKQETITIYNNLECTIDFDKLNKVEIISKEYFYDNLDNLINIFKDNNV